jgi:hypothetical protein
VDLHHALGHDHLVLPNFRNLGTARNVGFMR